MANPWEIAATGWGFVVLGWLLSPIISFVVNKLFDYFAFDTSRKLRELELYTIPILKLMLRDVEEQRMVRAAKEKGSESDLATLEKIANDLKSALYEAEDILGLVHYHRIKKEVTGDGEPHECSCVQHILSAAGACITRCKGTWFGRFIRPAVLQCAKGLSWLGATLCRTGEQIPVSQRSSNSVVQRLRAWSNSLDIQTHCRSMQRWLAKTYAAACYYRDWSYEVVGIKTNKKDDNTVDSFLPTMDRKSMRIGIQRIENIVSDLKKSHLLNQDSSEIRTKDANKEGSSTQEEIEDLHRMIERKVFGRDKEREHIRSMLREEPDSRGPSSSSRRHYSVICILGITGSGKSTLAQYVCDHEQKAEDKHFYPIMFSHASRTFRVDKIFRDMLEQTTQVRPSDTKGLKSLHKMLKENLKGNRFLLVLDDLWVSNENQNGLDILLDALNAGQSGSKILVTAQRVDAAADLGAQKQILLPDLEENDYLSLFMHYARLGATDDDGEYERIGRKIANKLHSSPIAAVTVGKRLLKNSRNNTSINFSEQKTTNINFWVTTANNDVLNETMGALWWSYQQLGSDIRQCFAYCSTFPRGYTFQRGQLVRIWIAQGFVRTMSYGKEELEDVGNRYIDELLTLSFLMQEERSIYDTDELFTIHDLLHELAERVAESDFHRIDLNGSPKNIPPGVCHVFIETNNPPEIAENYMELENLRNLIIKEHCTFTDAEVMEDDEIFEALLKSEEDERANEFVEVELAKKFVQVQERNHDLENAFDRLFMRLNKLRVLIIELNRDIMLACINSQPSLSFPASIDRMKHLRYLGFQFCIPKLILPGTFSKLYHMQTVEVLPDNPRVIHYPEDMANLIHLRHVITSARLAFPDVGRLTSLQKLPRFEVKDEQGYEVKQLKHLNKIQGTMEIRGLEFVGSKDEALQAQLSRKERVTKLSLFFLAGPPRDPDVVEAEVLEGLAPPKDLVELSIFHYKGSRYPSWMLRRQHPDAPKRLQKLELVNSSGLASFTEDSEVVIHLHELHIDGCNWDSLPEYMERLVSLQNLVIYECNNMEILPTLPRSLRKITIGMCHKLSTTCKQEGHQNWHKIQHIPEKIIYY